METMTKTVEATLNASGAIPKGWQSFSPALQGTSYAG